jgi:hypothetical protein
MRRQIVFLAVLAALLVVLASACGGSSKSSSPDTTPATTTAASSDSSGTPDFTSNANCQQLAKLGASLAKAITPGSGGTVDPEKYADVMNQMADAAPNDIRSDFKTFASAYSNFVKALKSSGYAAGSGKIPTPAQLLKLTGAAKQLSTPEVKAAEQHLTAWAHKNCMSR